ncbi:MAG: SIR2 family protein [Mobilitalea sp.]
MKNTLFLGNGFGRCLYNQKSWGELLDQADDQDDLLKMEGDTEFNLYPFIYERALLNVMNNCAGKDTQCIEYRDGCKPSINCERNHKTVLGNKLKIMSSDFLDNNLCELFEKLLEKKNIENIITTNYENLIEMLLTKCGYEYSKDESIHDEKVYSIRRHYCYKKNNRKIFLWKIHGDIAKVETIMLGYDHYCGSIAKIDAYIKGTYKRYIDIKTIPEKCGGNSFDEISWVELFFSSNIYVIGFGMDFSEIDIWWLLNRRSRLYIQNPNSIMDLKKSKIYFFVDKAKLRICEMLATFSVEVVDMKYVYKQKQPNPQYLLSVFDKIQNLAQEN